MMTVRECIDKISSHDKSKVFVIYANEKPSHDDILDFAEKNIEELNEDEIKILFSMMINYRNFNISK